MIEGCFGFQDVIKNAVNPCSIHFEFAKGLISFSEYTYRIHSVSLSLLVKEKNLSFYKELLNRERLGETFFYPSNLSLLESSAFKNKFKYDATFLIIYDEGLNEVSIARDTFGIIPLYYCHSNRGLCFSTNLTYLLAHKEFSHPSNLNAEKISGYLTPGTDGLPYTEETFYTNIRAVLPGHFIHCNSRGTISKPIISFRPQKWQHLSLIEEFGEEFRNIFRDSVRKNTLHHENISSHLSGGLDSSSVSAMIRYVAPDLKFNTLYGETNTALTDESHYAVKVAKSIRSEHLVVYPTTNELEVLIKNTALYGFPEHMSTTPALQNALISKASSIGSDILMTGTDGDSIVGHGFNYLDHLFNCKNWQELEFALSRWASFSGGLGAKKGWDTLTIFQKKKLSFNHFFYRKLTQATSIQQVKEILYISKFKFGISYNQLLRKGLLAITNRIKYFNQIPKSIQSIQLINEKTSLPILSLPKALMNDLPNRYLFAFEDVFYHQGIVLNEENFQLGKDNNIELGYPFYNTELFELSMAVPSSLKFNYGKSRSHLREAMKGILIDDVRNRPDKGIFNEYAQKSTRNLYLKSGDFLGSSNHVWHYVDRHLFMKCVKLLFEENKHLPHVYNRTTFFISRTINLSVWLDQQ